MNGLFEGMGKSLLYLIVFVLFVFGVMKCTKKWVDMVEDNQVIKSEKPLIQTLELRIENNKVDTLYVYRKP